MNDYMVICGSKEILFGRNGGMKSTVTILGLMSVGHFAEGVNLEAASIMYLLAAALAAAGFVNLIIHQKKL